MKLAAGMSLALGLTFLCGCNEFVRPDTQATSVDVVGEPSDPTPDAAQQADILGSGVPSNDDMVRVTDVTPQRDVETPVRDDQPDPANSESDPDVAGGLGLAKPVSLKTQKPEASPVNPSKR